MAREVTGRTNNFEMNAVYLESVVSNLPKQITFIYNINRLFFGNSYSVNGSVNAVSLPSIFCSRAVDNALAEPGTSLDVFFNGSLEGVDFSPCGCVDVT